ncbi:MAG: thrombospondin type 3 repeat-containing protein [Pseudomonadota bacterium]
MRTLSGSILVLVAALLSTASVHAAEITVTTFADENSWRGMCSQGPDFFCEDDAVCESRVQGSYCRFAPGPDTGCSLREAVDSANADRALGGCTAGETGVRDVILLGEGTYTLSRRNPDLCFPDPELVEVCQPSGGDNENAFGDLDIAGDLEIRGLGASVTILDGAGNDRIVHVLATHSVEIRDLTLRGGRALTGGGAIFNQGNLALIDVVARDNVALGSDGITDEVCFEGICSEAHDSRVKGPGAGGAIFNSGFFAARGCSFFDNLAVGGAGGAGSSGAVLGGGGGGGAAGAGGAIYNDNGQVRLSTSTLTGNEARGGPGGPGGLANPDNYLSYNPGGMGGGLGGGGGSSGGGRGGHLGGGGGGGGTCEWPNHGGRGGFGGGGAGSGACSTRQPVCDPASRNYCPNAGFGGGAGGLSNSLDGAAGGGGAGLGGAIFDHSGFVTLDHVTIVANVATAGVKGAAGTILTQAEDGQAIAGGVFSLYGTIAPRGSIIVDNVSTVHPDCSGYGGGVDSQGFNLFDSQGGCTGDPSDVLSGTPGLGDFGDHGGSTPTVALEQGSPALHAGTCVDQDGALVTADQRGSARPASGVGCDIGAFQVFESDTDGILDDVDNCPTVDNPGQEDSDGDQRGDACDPCPGLATTSDADGDADGLPDACDLCPSIADSGADSDQDGVGDACDNCPGVANADQSDGNADGVGDVCTSESDGDDDGVADAADNCPGIANPDQEDADGDGTGDACEPALPPLDTDGDGVPDVDDNCPLVPNSDQQASDGVGRACSGAPVAQQEQPDEAGGCSCSANGNGVPNTALFLIGGILLAVRKRSRAIGY